MREIVLAHIKKLRWTPAWQRCGSGAADVSWGVKFLPTGFKISLDLLLKGTYRKKPFVF